MWGLQIEDMSQQAQMAAAEKFKEPAVNPAKDTAAHTTVSRLLVVVYFYFLAVFLSSRNC